MIKKGTKPIDFFDYKNIAGRSGRMKRHYKGIVVRFEPEPDQMELFVDIPLFNHEKCPLEILVSLDANEIEEKSKTRLDEFRSYPQDLQELLKTNSGVSIKGQLDIIKKIESNLDYYHNLLSWRTYPPDFDSLSIIIELCWNTLATQSDRALYIEKIGRISARWLASFTRSYTRLRSIPSVISHYINQEFWINKIPDLQERTDIASYSILYISRHWFDYKLPKWITTISNIQEHVFTKHNLQPGSFTYFASNLENGFLHSNSATLLEYDIPASAINKLRRVIPIDQSAETIIKSLNELTDEELNTFSLIQYEINKIRSAL
ncbi:hypothetical protein HUW51_14790 [Adhaeribacter swui]|uniref:Uncharacterized protein n=1 Tax=Adhaeribacter swui TaxID=2086471 RepID=A0A7G7G9U4_9BACT|nr:hypothetical protein [Adhaeribacter swui]QNF33928.1 hypothetical protein HUW51_14790 [Adhaeribacter swui]